MLQLDPLQFKKDWEKISDEPRKDAISARSNWLKVARRSQITPPPGDWLTWLILAGRGWGKTRTGAEDVSWFAEKFPGSRIAVVASTYADARDTCVEGESGLLRVIPKSCVQAWNRSLGELILENSSRFKLFGAEEPDRLRGPQHHRAWCDELAAWTYSETWDQVLFGLRLGVRPQAVITTTPKPTVLIRQLIADKTTLITRGKTFDNKANLAPAALQRLLAKYEGTRLGRQELDAEIIDEVEGALWTREQIEKARSKGKRFGKEFKRIVIGVDPAVTAKAESNLTGIVAGGIGLDDNGYVLSDASGKYSPAGWAAAAVGLYHSLQADAIIAEGNQGGDMVRHTIHSVDNKVPVHIVHASRGKQARAEPVAALYEQGRIGHCDTFPELEDQMCTWEPLGDLPSPDRIDALVWMLTSLMVSNKSPQAQFGTWASR